MGAALLEGCFAWGCGYFVQAKHAIELKQATSELA
jgi:hypothetical protein